MVAPDSTDEALSARLERRFGSLPEAEREAVLRSWRLVAAWVERLHREPAFADEPAQIFLPPGTEPALRSGR